VITTINTGHPLFNTNDERLRIRAVLKHLGSGADLRDLPATASEKVALVKAASQRKLIVWHKGRGRYELSPSGWCELAPRRRFGIGSMLLGSTAGATIGAVALGVFWVAAGVLHGPAPRLARTPVAVGAQVASLSAPAVEGALTKSAPLAPASVQIAAPAAPPPGQTAAPAASAPVAPAAVPVPEAAPAPAAEPTRVVEEPTAEQLAQAGKAKQAAAAKKARQRAAARRRREDAARAWAATEPRTRQAESSGFGGFGGYSGYGGQGSWFAYR
jgi:hypothetical protein